jgi:hypothetical protein
MWRKLGASYPGHWLKPRRNIAGNRFIADVEDCHEAAPISPYFIGDCPIRDLNHVEHAGCQPRPRAPGRDQLPVELPDLKMTTASRPVAIKRKSKLFAIWPGSRP